MPYVITEACITVKDKACVDVCPVDCIYEGPDQLFIRKVTPPRPQILAGIAQNINQLQSHPVLLPEREHFHFAPVRRLPETSLRQGDEILEQEVLDRVSGRAHGFIVRLS